MRWIRPVAILLATVAVTAMAGTYPASADPRITVRVSKGVSSQPLQHKYNLHLPVLTGANRKSRRTVQKITGMIVDQQLQFLVRWRNRYDPTLQCDNRAENSSLRARTRKVILAQHYATAAVIVSTWPACGNVDQVNARTWNVDLRKGVSLHLDDLIDRRATYPAVRDALASGARTVNGKPCGATMYKRPTLYNWVLKPYGIQFWFDKYKVSPGYCGAVAISVPWRELPLTPRGQKLRQEIRSS